MRKGKDPDPDPQHCQKAALAGGEKGRSDVSAPHHHPISLKDIVTVILLLDMHLNGLFGRDRVESIRKSIRKTKTTSQSSNLILS
jgi:hypothetical protein